MILKTKQKIHVV